MRSTFSFQLPHPRFRSLPLLLIAVGLTGGLAIAQEGVKQTEALVKKGEQTIKAIGDARLQLEKTLGVYNSIIDGKAVDSKAAYNDLGGAVKDTEGKVADVKKRKEEMDVEADKLFTSWKDSAAAISSPDLKKRSEERLVQTRERQGKITEAGQQARSEYETLLTGLKDQMTYLGHDLTPGGVASVKGDAVKLNEQAKKVFAKIDTTVATANSSLDSLRKP